MVRYYAVYISFDAIKSEARLYGTAGGKGSDTENACNNAPFTVFKTLNFPNNTVAAMRTWLTANVFQGCALIASSGSSTGENDWAGTRPIFTKHGKVDVQFIQNAVAGFSFPDWAKKAWEIEKITHLNDFSESNWQY